MPSFQSKDGTPLSYRQSGSGPPLLLVHGTGTDAARWRPVLPLLEPRFAVFALDRRGHGLSGDAAAYALEQEFEDISAMIETMAAGPVDVIAHSYGGLCALGAASQGARLRRLVVYEPPLPMLPGAYFSPDLITAMGELMARGDNAGAVAAFAIDALKLAPQELAGMRRLASWSVLEARAAIVWRELQAVERLSGHPEAFRECRVPTLLILGGDSPPQYRATAEGLHAVLASSRIAILEGQAHAAINAAPALFMQEALAFLSGPE